MKTAVIVHGCHLQAKSWENIVFGVLEEGKLGRIPAGVLAFSMYQAEFMIWTTGASEKDGLCEAEYTQRLAFERIEDIHVFLEEYYRKRDAVFISYNFAERFKREEHHRIDIISQNTAEEMRRTLELCKTEGIERLVLVSSPTHIARCLQEYLKVREKDPSLSVHIAVAPSDTCFDDSTVGDVVIVEPPHRGDMPQVSFHKTVRQIFQFMKKPDVAFRFNDGLQSLINLYKKEL